MIRTWPTTREQNHLMESRQIQRRAAGMTKAELWAYLQLKETGYNWTHEARWDVWGHYDKNDP